jgi:hypothetical protein
VSRATGTTRQWRWPRGRLAASLAVATALILCGSAEAAVRWVGDDYYGINFQQIRTLNPHASAKHTRRIAKLGIRQVRIGVAWPRIEPQAPVNGVHDYRWDDIDAEISALARHRIQPQLNITQAPSWDARNGVFVDLRCPPGRASSRAPISIRPYIQLTRAIAARYGRGGDFWSEHPSLPAEPVTRYEIWNEPNLRGGWCPQPQPDVYAEMFVGAARAIRGVDRRAEVLTGGVAPPASEDPRYGLGIATFLARAKARQPRIFHKASGAAVHIYTSVKARQMVNRIAWFRDQLHAGGVPNSVPMLINEIGWPTQGGFPSGFLGLGMEAAPIVPERNRTSAYRKATVKIPRTSCNVMGIVPQAWISLEVDPTEAEDWFGMADPVTRKPYRSARSYSRSVRLMRGELRASPPSRALMACPGMRAPKPALQATVKLRRAGSEHPRMRFRAIAGEARPRRMQLRLPRSLRFANGKAWRHGVKARKGSRKLRGSALRHSQRKLKVRIPRNGARAVVVCVRGHALRRVKPIRHRRLSFPVVVRDADPGRSALTVRTRAR